MSGDRPSGPTQITGDDLRRAIAKPQRNAHSERSATGSSNRAGSMAPDEETLCAKEAVLWVEMARHFGELWLRRYGETDVDGAWAPILQGLSARQVAGGIAAIRQTWRSDFPPNPSQFANLARDSVRPYDAPVESLAQLAHLKSSPERTARGVAELRLILGGKR